MSIVITLENDSVDAIELEELADDGTVVGRAVIANRSQLSFVSSPS